MTLPLVDFAFKQTPTVPDWEGFFNSIINYINAGFTVDDLRLEEGRLNVSISGDAATLNGMTAAEIVGGDFPDINKTLIDIIGGGLVLSGGVATKDAYVFTQLNITPIQAVQRVSSNGYLDRVELGAKIKTVALPSATYYLDLPAGGLDYSFGTSHHVGDYIPIAEVVTNSAGEISQVLQTMKPVAMKMLSGLDAKLSIANALAGAVSQGTAAQAITDATSIGTALAYIVNQIKVITGKTNWYNLPDKSIAQLKDAASIAIADVGEKTEESTVEGALQELYTKVAEARTYA